MSPITINVLIDGKPLDEETILLDTELRRGTELALSAVEPTDSQPDARIQLDDCARRIGLETIALALRALSRERSCA